MDEICVNKYDAGGGGARAIMYFFFVCRYPARLCMNLFAIVVQFTWVGRQAGKQASGVEACGRV